MLVTGAGGSIGSELCRQIVLERPRQLVLLDHNEFAPVRHSPRVAQACAPTHDLPVEVAPLLASVRNYERMREICQLYRPATVYHAAAYKHVPLVERNPAEGVLNNVLRHLEHRARRHRNGVGDFVLISTDKAVRPTNVMGASKRMAEMVLQALAASRAALSCPMARGARFATTRVFDGALWQRAGLQRHGGAAVSQADLAGGPVTVTHAEITRYFMTIPEAAQLVLQAGAMAQGGDVFVLDMGEPVKIIDLARRMVAAVGPDGARRDNPEGDIEIQITGLRPGEKLYEELLIGDNPQPPRTRAS